MAEESMFRGIIEFFFKLGIYDVILPFLLVFTLVFAILEKTRVLGTEEIEGKKYTRKNLNAMVAFATGFLTIASAKVVAVINQTVANVMLLLIVCIFFLLLVGSFFKEEPHAFFLEKGGWRTTFMILVFLGLAFIFLDALDLLDQIFDFLGGTDRGEVVGPALLLVVIVMFIAFITHDRAEGGKSSGQSGGH